MITDCLGTPVYVRTRTPSLARADACVAYRVALTTTLLRHLVPRPSLACSRRPYLASECKSLPEAEKWRREILREVTKKVAEIQNGA